MPELVGAERQFYRRVLDCGVAWPDSIAMIPHEPAEAIAAAEALRALRLVRIVPGTEDRPPGLVCYELEPGPSAYMNALDQAKRAFGLG